jgi:hypothetical protein
MGRGRAEKFQVISEGKFRVSPVAAGDFLWVNGPDAGPRGAARVFRKGIALAEFGIGDGLSEQVAGGSGDGGGPGPGLRGEGSGPDHGGIRRSGEPEPRDWQVGRLAEPQVRVGEEPAEPAQEGQGQALTGQ